MNDSVRPHNTSSLYRWLTLRDSAVLDRYESRQLRQTMEAELCGSTRCGILYHRLRFMGRSSVGWISFDFSSVADQGTDRLSKFSWGHSFLKVNA